MRGIGLVVLGLAGLYALAWGLYVLKSAVGIDLIANRHMGGGFLGSDRAVRWLKGHV